MSATKQKGKSARSEAKGFRQPRNKEASRARRVEIGAKIRKLRENLGLYQWEVAKKLVPPVWPQAVAKWEAGTVSLPIDRLAELAAIYGVEVSELIG